MGYRVGELAKAAGVSVELVRSYQSKGLLPAPRHEGRIVLYGEHHLERLRVIRELKGRGYSLKAIASVLEQAGDRSDPLTLVAPLGREGQARETMTLGQLAQRTGMPPAMLRSLEASGVLRPLPGAGARYTEADVTAVRMLLRLIGTGLPLEEFLALARRLMEAMESVADGAVSAFERYGPEARRPGPVRPTADGSRDAPLDVMVEAATSLLAYHFERMLRGAAARAGVTGAAGPGGRRERSSTALPA